jgi:hypothetical protein
MTPPVAKTARRGNNPRESLATAVARGRPIRIAAAA